MQQSPTSSERLKSLEAERLFREISLSSLPQIRELFGDRPITLLKLLDPTLRFPKRLRYIFALLWRQQTPDGKAARRFIIKGPRGGGKTKLMGAIGFSRWLLKLRSIVAMGGSMTQAQNVYNYFSGHCYSQPSVIAALPEEPTMKETVSDKGNYFKAVPASQKQVRGPHPDDLAIDEACEAKDEIILAALPMVNSSPDPFVLMTSTFHKIFGLFQETWDQADRFGWVRLSWDIFDVTQSFDPKVWTDPELLEQIPDLSIAQAGELSLEHRAAGRTGDPEGWVPMVNIIQAWREKSTVDWFDVEMMGSRPSAAGLVNNPEDVDACVVTALGQGMKYVEKMETSAGLDWGFRGMTAWEVYGAMKDQRKSNLSSRTWSQTRSEVIIKKIVADVLEFKIRFIFADSSHPFENQDLKNALAKLSTGKNGHRCALMEVPFVSEKEGMLGNYRAHFQRKLLRIPKANQEAIWQHKRYHYQPKSDKPAKEDDHIPDATMLALKRWPLNVQSNPLSVPPKKREPTHEQKQADDRSYPTSAEQSTVTGGLLDEQF